MSSRLIRPTGDEGRSTLEPGAPRAPRPRRVAIIAGQLVLGGAERQLYLWLSRLDRGRFDPVVVTLHPDSGDFWEEPIAALGIPMLEVPRRFGWPGRVADVTRLLRPYRPELVHAWHLFASPYAGLAARLLGAKASLGSLRASFDSFRRQSLLAAVTPALVDGIVVNSRDAADRLAEGRPRMRRKLHWVANAVEEPTEPRGPIRAQLSQRFGIPDARVWLGSSARFDAGKRLDLVVDAFSRVAGAGGDVHLLLIGDGGERAALQARVAAAGLGDRVTFTGLDASARSWMSALDVFAFTSMDEGFPNVVLEACAAGVPVVGWRSAFLQETFVHGETAVLVQPGNVEELAAAIRNLVDDPARRERLGDRARRHVLEHFGVGRFVDGLTRVYDAALGTAAAAGAPT